MKRHAFLFFVGMAGISCIAYAQDRREAAPQAATIRVTVDHVDYANGSLQVHDLRGRARTINTSPSTSFIGARSSGYEELSDIRPGARLTVEGSRVGSELNAVLIKVQNAR